MEEKEIKNESGNILTGQAGMKVTGWRRIVGLVRKDMRREVFAGWRRKESSGGRKVWCSVKNLTGKVFAGCGRKTVADWRKMSGVAVLPAGAG